MPEIKFNCKMIHQKTGSVNLKTKEEKVFKLNNYKEKMENIEKNQKRHMGKSLRSSRRRSKVEGEESEWSAIVFEEIMAKTLLKLVEGFQSTHSRASPNVREGK